MEEIGTNAIFMDKLAELNELEIKKAKVLAVIFQKTMQQLKNKKMQDFEINFQNQAEFYGQKLENYEEVYQNSRLKYEEQLLKVIDKYNELFINLYLELQEAECNQKIAMTNLKRSYDTKQEQISEGKIEEYHRKVMACRQKKENYDKIIRTCEEELEQCVVKTEKKINSLFANKSSQIALKEPSVVKKIIDKIKNVVSGKTKFHTYVLEPIHVELEMMDSKMPDIIESIQQETILFVAKMKQAKAKTNEIFENMI